MNPDILVDAGNLLFEPTRKHGHRPKEVDARRELLLEDARRLGFHALVPGGEDLKDGLANYQGWTKGLPVIAINLETPDGKTVFPGTRTITVKGVKVGFIGLLDPLSFADAKGFQVTPMKEALARGLAEVKKDGAQLTVLVARAFRKNLEPLLTAGGGPDVAIAGADRHGRTSRLGRTVLVAGGDRGRTLTHLELELRGAAPWTLDDGLAQLEAELKQHTARVDRYARLAKGKHNSDFYAQKEAQSRQLIERLSAELATAKKETGTKSRYTEVKTPLDKSIADHKTLKSLVEAKLSPLRSGEPPRDPHAGHAH